MLLFAKRFSREIKTMPRYVRKRMYRNFNADEFVAAVRQISWLDLYLTEDVNNAVQILSSKLLFVLDTMAPMKTIQVWTKYAPWLSKNTLDLIKERNMQQQIASEKNNREEWAKFKALQNKINNRMK